MLSDIRAEQLKLYGQQSRISEAQDMFAFLDRGLNGIRDQDLEWGMTTRLSEVMTSGDFAYAIQEFVARSMRPAYQRKRFNFEPFVSIETVPNFMTVTRYQKQQGLQDLELVGAKGEARAGYVADAVKREYRVYRWAKQWDFSMECLINDDLGYFNDQSRLMGEAARRSLEKFISRMYTNAISIARLAGALYSTTGRLTTARISAARMAFNQRTDAAGEPINAALKYIVHHSGLVDTVATIQRSTLVPELATNATNVVAGTFTAIEDPYITGAAPNLPWWAFTDYRTDIVPLILARRAGMPGPMLIRKKSDQETFATFVGGGAPLSPQMGDFATGNVVVKVEDHWGTYTDANEGNLYDFRGAYYSSGTAP